MNRQTRGLDPIKSANRAAAWKSTFIRTLWKKWEIGGRIGNCSDGENGKNFWDGPVKGLSGKNSF